MRNWKYINGAKSVRVGNAETENTWTPAQAKKYYEDAKKEFDEKGDMFSKRKLDEVKSTIEKEYYAAYKHLEELERKKNDNLYNKGGSGEIPYYNEAKQNYTHWGLLRETIGNDTPAEYAKRPPKVVGGNKKTGNYSSASEYIKKLEEDAGRELSHEEKAKDLKKSGWSKDDALSAGILKEVVERVYNSSPEEADKEFFHKLAEDAKEHDEAADKENEELKKTGNGPDPKEAQRLVNLHNYQKLKEIVESNMKRYEPGHPEYERLKKLSEDYEKEIKKNSKVGNSNVGNGATIEDMLEMIKVNEKAIRELKGKKYDSMGYSSQEAIREYQDEIERMKRHIERLKERNKVGNKGQWNSSKTMYAKWDDEKGRPGDEYAVITWLGEGKGGLVNIWKGHQQTGEKFGSYDKNELQRWAEQRIGNEYKPNPTNNLKRAFNAMAKNKKVKNSAVREYKHSDGRVAQIDFNEDGSDADMSIYEGSKEIEQKNFSTIRDAEQYVTSHGFRRI